MEKYTAGYVHTNPNFVIQNLETNQINDDLLPILYVVKNILQRGYPTTLSKYLQSKLGEIHNLNNFKERFLFATNQTPIWKDTIKGDRERNYYPAKDFFEKIIPTEFGEYSFIQSLLIPEIEINEITGEEDNRFVNQQVDFYLPQAKLVIEIDGQQHKNNDIQRVSDYIRDTYLSGKGVTTIRITTEELQNKEYKKKVEKILTHFKQYERQLALYENAYIKINNNNQISEIEINTKLLPTAIIRFQILLIELLIHNYLTFDKDWNFNILSHEDLPTFAELAIDDLLIWIDKLYLLKNKHELIKPKCNIKLTTDRNTFHLITKAINIDFSLFKRYTDENKINEGVIFVRTDYFDDVKNKNYFKVSTTEPINYHIRDEDEHVLEFFLENIFDKSSFLDGQFQIIENILNRKDTIGLLPTGGGKSLCYQLPCLLQPSINFVVCPIKALMYDQKENLNKIFITRTNFITSDLSAPEKEKILTEFAQGRYLFIWISPERFQIQNFRNKISTIVTNFSIAYAVVDEVHCLSEWGHDFRTSYLNLAKTIDNLSPKDENGEGKIKFIGLTATASINVLKDIKVEFSRQKQHLEDENIKSLLDYSRKELQFEVINDNGNKKENLEKILKKLKDEENFTKNKEKAGIVFTPYVNSDYGCYKVSNILNRIYENKVSWFSGDVPRVSDYDETGNGTGREVNLMPEDEFNKYKQQVQKDFKENRCQLLVATKAFGMGIDKQNIFYTFHYGLPSSVEALYQEAGRAGRWDKQKEENRDKKGKCYILYSPEICKQEIVDELFRRNTSFSRIKEINDKIRREDKKDIFRQFYLFCKGRNDIEEDFKIIVDIIEIYLKDIKENSTKKIFWSDAISRLSINEDILEKAIYRLSLLGIVSDWTTDFRYYYNVHFNSLNEENIIENVSYYIKKYEPDIDIRKKIEQIQEEDTILKKAILYLLSWIFNHIIYNRKRSLQTIYELSSTFTDNDSFKQNIDAYFTFTNDTFILQHIIENPKDFAQLFNIFKKDNGSENRIEFKNKTEFKKFKNSINRFLESYNNSIGLNFISGFACLVLDEYENNDGKERFESALSKIKETFTQEQQKDFLNRLKVLGTHLTEEQKVKLSKSISKFYPEMLEEFAEYYDLAYLLNDVYEEKVKELKKLNIKLYERLTEI
ncbi:MAG: DEAD/DEAH box helicase [Bacteroidales bacterium]|jgi:ATP-dependent DNA helicase RecQ|nr:DEAD/DEAH box helicase [Bacteroidales bacterium]